MRLFFGRVEPSQAPRTFDDAMNLVADRYDAKEATGLWTSSSRNGWHIASLLDDAAKRRSKSLDFLRCDFVVLGLSETAAALATLSQALADAGEGIDALATTATEEASEFFLKLTVEPTDTERETRDLLRQAYLEAAASHEVDWSGDAGYGASVGYFAFLKSLAASLLECLLRGERFFFCQIG